MTDKNPNETEVFLQLAEIYESLHDIERQAAQQILLRYTQKMNPIQRDAFYQGLGMIIYTTYTNLEYGPDFLSRLLAGLAGSAADLKKEDRRQGKN